MLPASFPPSADRSQISSFYRFVYERHRVWHNRFVVRLPQASWTSDPLLQKSRYTNVYRELDRGTLYLDRHLSRFFTTPLSFEKKTSLLWEICVYRLLNKVETFERVGIPTYRSFHSKTKRDAWFASLDSLRQSGVSVWTSAHISLQSNIRRNRLDTFRYILDALHPECVALTDVVVAADCMHSAFKHLTTQYGFGSFTTYEVVSDLALLPCTTYDSDTWAHAGPGCIPGIQLLFPEDKGQSMYLRSMQLLRDYQDEFFSSLSLPFSEIQYMGRPLTLRNIEHSLCEYRKYWYESQKKGRPRPRFTPLSSPEQYSF